MKAILYLVALLILSGCVSHPEDPVMDPSVIAPGVLNLGALPGSFVPADCGEDMDFNADGSFLGCVAFPLEAQSEQEAPFEWQYIQALKDTGWTFAGGLANVFYVERPDERSGCNERLALIAWMLGDKEEIAKYRTAQEPEIDWSKMPNRAIWFFMEAGPVCHG